MACRLATVVAAALAALVLFVGGVTCAAEVAGEVRALLCASRLARERPADRS